MKYDKCLTATHHGKGSHAETRQYTKFNNKTFVTDKNFETVKLTVGSDTVFY